MQENSPYGRKSPQWSERRRAEVERLSAHSRELMRQIDEIKKRMSEVATQVLNNQRPD